MDRKTEKISNNGKKERINISFDSVCISACTEIDINTHTQRHANTVKDFCFKATRKTL